jgi:hypothetical protein
MRAHFIKNFNNEYIGKRQLTVHAPIGNKLAAVFEIRNVSRRIAKRNPIVCQNINQLQSMFVV